METTTLKEQYTALLASQPGLRIRNAADILGVSEAELLATATQGKVTRLVPDFPGILGNIETLGYVMALTRNNEVVHERKGVYLNPSFGPHASLFVGEDIDLRMFLNQWAFAFAVEEVTRGKVRQSLQFFGADGLAMHKIYLTDQSNQDAFNELVGAFLYPDQESALNISPSPEEAVELPDSEIDVIGFRNAWIALKDTHDFFGLLRKFQVSRTQALRLAPEGEYAVEVDLVAVRKVLQAAAETDTPIMVFVGNRGMIQIHTGTVHKLFEHGEWYNVMDPAFNLHIHEPGITSAWIVRKPTEDGMVTSLECFNASGELVVTFFGKRKPGIPELEEWRKIVADIENEFSK